MLTLTTVAIQESPALRAINADKGISKEVLQSDRVLLADAVHTAVREKCADVLADYVYQICDPDSYPDVPESELEKVDFDHIREGIMANINSIKIDAGTGFTSTHKANLIANGTCEAIDFIDPKKRGGADTGSAKTAKSGTIAL